MGPISSGHKNFNNVKNQCYKKHSMCQFYASSDCRLSFVPSCWIFVYVCSSLHRDGQDPESGACDPQSLLYKQSAWHYDMHGKYKKLNYRVKVALQRVGNLRGLQFKYLGKDQPDFRRWKLVLKADCSITPNNLKAETGTGLVSQLDTAVLTPFEQQDQINA